MLLQRTPHVLHLSELLVTLLVCSLSIVLLLNELFTPIGGDRVLHCCFVYCMVVNICVCVYCILYYVVCAAHLYHNDLYMFDHTFGITQTQVRRPCSNQNGTNFTLHCFSCSVTRLYCQYSIVAVLLRHSLLSSYCLSLPHAQ
jgi:hypothetical protein